MRGTVKFFNATKAYGFITPVSGGADVFVHITATLKAGLPPLVAGQTIHFDIANDRRRGTHATNLRYQENADEPDAILKLPIARDWYKPGIARVRGAPADSDAQWREATRATIEVVVRKLLGLGWTRRHTSARRVDGRAESRYLRAPHDPLYEIRISNHPHPKVYPGRASYLIIPETLQTARVADIVTRIVTEYRRAIAACNRPT